MAKNSEKNSTVEINQAHKIIVAPWITEKSHYLMTLNKYIFKITGEADKNKVKRTIEGLYKVKVIQVNVINIPPKKRMFGRTVGEKSAIHKAIVTLKEGDKIELFKGV